MKATILMSVGLFAILFSCGDFQGEAQKSDVKAGINACASGKNVALHWVWGDSSTCAQSLTGQCSGMEFYVNLASDTETCKAAFLDCTFDLLRMRGNYLRKSCSVE